MESAHLFEAVESSLAQGRFGAAHASLLESSRTLERADKTRHDVLSAELLSAIGNDMAAFDGATRCLAGGPAPEHEIRLRRILGQYHYERGEVATARDHISAARALAIRVGLLSELGRVQLADLNLTLKFEPLEAVFAALPTTRRDVLRAGDPLLIVELRGVVARAEARRHNFTEAARHNELCGSLLAAYPNAWLQGHIELDSSVMLAFLGDLDNSLAAAERALNLARQSGHLRTKLAAAVNISHVQERRGEFAAARHHIEHVLRSEGATRHLMRAALDSLANVLISVGDFEECKRVMAEISRRAKADVGARPHWDEISELHTRARLAIAEHRWHDATNDLTDALNLSHRYGEELWRKRILVTRARCRAFQDEAVGAADDLLRSFRGEMDPQLIAEYHASLAALEPSGSSTSTAAFGRAIRLASALRSRELVQDLTRAPEDRALSLTTSSTALPRPDLDSAVTLLELAGYPHILGPETLAVLRGAGCVDAAALLAAGKTTRIVESHGWDPAEAETAATTRPAGVELLPLGRHRDEEWSIVARPKTGLDDYCTFAAIRKILATALALDHYRRDEKQRAALWPAEALDGDPESVWASEQMAETLGIARRIAPTPLSVLLTGETGTGKEMLARAIHRASDRASGVFLPFNCTAVPREMLDSQLFGYRKGAFTGAETSFPGVIRSAAGGTLFLDEIADVPPDVQPKLLRFLETHEIHPLGEQNPVTVDVRVIAATNANLEQLVADGRFREDLFYRLNVIRLKLPPLRNRREEIPPLVHHYLRRFGDEQRKARLALSDETLEYLLLYSWPGNVRQLANEVRRMVALAEPDTTLTPAQLSAEIQASRRTVPAAPEVDTEARVRLDQPLPIAVEMLEQLMVRRALDRAHGRVEEASRLLGISRKGLFLKRRRWGLREAS